MKTLKIPTREVRKRLRYCPETGKLFWKTKPSGPVDAQSEAGSVDGQGYVGVKLGGTTYKAHRLAFVLMGKPVPTLVDHANGIRTDNRWLNLRPADHSTNQWNKRTRNEKPSGLPKGVSVVSPKCGCRNKLFRSRIQVRGVSRSLGNFRTPGEAHAAYAKAAATEFASYARVS